MRIVNRRAGFDYKILEKVEAGIVLTGLEVKSIRAGRVSINNAYIIYGGHVYIRGMHIGDSEAKECDRILLVHKRQKNKIIAINKEGGKTAVALEMYFNSRGYAKILYAIVEGKTKHDKRETIKKREMSRLIRHYSK